MRICKKMQNGRVESSGVTRLNGKSCRMVGLREVV